MRLEVSPVNAGLDGCSAGADTELMLSTSNESLANSAVNFDGAPLAEVTLDETDFRIDSGKQGTAFSVSSRPTGTWDWTFRGEARWDGSALRSRALERRILVELSSALSGALSALE
jgi:hypothetical protein